MIKNHPFRQARYPEDMDVKRAKLRELFRGPRRPTRADAQRLKDQPIEYTKLDVVKEEK